MQASRKRQGTEPRVAGAIAGAFAFGLGAAALVYFVELRGAGIAAELSSVRGPELLIFVAAVVLVSIATHFTVAAVARRVGRGDVELQELLQRAHSLDVTDPGALRAFDSVPPLRDVVAQLVTEKAHVRELSDRLETLRGEFGGIADGMRRSAQDLGHLREENLSGPAMQVVLLWNGLVDRLQSAVAPSNVPAAGPAVSAGAGHPDISGLVSRLDELESELTRLRDAVATPEAPAAPLEPVTSWRADEPAFQIETTATRWGEPEAEAVVEPATSWGTPEPERAPEEPATISARDLFLDDGAFGPEEGFAQVAPEPQVNRPDTRRVPDPFAPRSLLPDEFGAAAAAPAPAPRRAAVPPPTPAAPAPPAPEFEGMRFPEFVGGARQRPADKVDLTYESQSSDDVAELPASALLFDSEGQTPTEDGVFDLRSFGATEFDK